GLLSPSHGESVQERGRYHFPAVLRASSLSSDGSDGRKSKVRASSVPTLNHCCAGFRLVAAWPRSAVSPSCTRQTLQNQTPDLRFLPYASLTGHFTGRYPHKRPVFIGSLRVYG